jgi:hypothetical protein
MARIALPFLALLLGAACAVALVSCGGSSSDQGLLPGDSASQILANLNSVEASANSGDCATAADQVGTVAEQVDSLGSDVDPQLKKALQIGVHRLETLVNAPDACVTTSESTATTTEQTTQAPSTETTESTATTHTATTQPTQPTQPTVPTTPTQTQTGIPTSPTTGGTSPGGKRPGRHR